MSATVVLISGKKSLRDEISSLLPPNWTLMSFSSIGEVRNNLDFFVQTPENDFTFWIDTADQTDWPSQLPDLPHQRGRIVAILEDAGQRDTALHSGADDYLLRPLLASDMRIRLERSRHDSETIRGLLRHLYRKDRQASIGQLTSHVCHEINNAMQATRGALALALEEPDLPVELTSYLVMCQDETQRVVDFVSNIRRVYFAENKTPEPLAAEQLIRQVIAATLEELENTDVRVQEDFPADLPLVYGIRDHLYLAFLSIVLNLSEVLQSTGGGEMRVSLRTVADFLQLSFSAGPTRPFPQGSSKTELVTGENPALDVLLCFTPAAEIIRAGDGKVDMHWKERELTILVCLPVPQQGRLGEVPIGQSANSDCG
jgi:signal transduction histidine kinase